MRHASRGLALLPVLVVAALLPAPVAAQSEYAACRLLDENGVWGKPFQATFEECVQAMGVEIALHGLDELYASWDAFYLHALLSGDVYVAALDQMDNPVWTYWGSWRLTLEELLALVEADLNDYWSGVFEEQGRVYYPVNHVRLYETQQPTPCGPTQLSNAFYCRLGHGIYLDRKLLLTQMEQIGDFAPAVILAHEWGHSIQAQLGIMQTELLSIELELQADCYAGAFAAYLADGSQRLILEDGDLEEGANSLFLLGDPEGHSWFDPTAHGSGNRRHRAFWRGFEGGPEAC